MCHSRSRNNKANHIHERVLRIAYQDFQSSFSALLVKHNSFTIRQRNLYFLAIEIKIKINISSEIMNDIFDFPKNSAYVLRYRNCFAGSNNHSTHFGINSFANTAAKIWNKVSNKIKDAGSLTVFKSKIKKWVPQGCP